MMDDESYGIIDKDSYYKDPPRVEDLSELVNNTLESVKPRLPKNYDEEVLKELLLELMLVEKKCRQKFDGESNSLICNFILTLLYDFNDFNNMFYYLVLLCKKRGQLKTTIVSMVDLAERWLDSIPSLEVRLELFNTLDKITLGKIYLEKQRAQIIFKLAKLKEDEGNIKESASILQNIEVETYGSLNKLEKIRYILEQMRVNLLNGDYIRFFMTSKKITESALDDYVPEKLQFYDFMIQYYHHDFDIENVTKSLYTIYSTKKKLFLDSTNSTDDSPSNIDQQYYQDYLTVLEKLLLYLILLSLNEENIEYMKKVNEDEKKFIKQLLTVSPFFQQFLNNFLIPHQLDDALVEKINSMLDERCSKLLYDRIIQHNVKIVSKYYNKITLERLSTLLNINSDKLENEISNMVEMGIIDSKINRITGIVKFQKKLQTEIILNNWVNNITKLMELVDQCSRLVQKEKMIHEARSKQIQLDTQFSS
ncbi:PCI domain protein [Theileria parva strain Muguga]|uniref:PCI domain protein n=1 Tax=Theileria parva strain Muguga TaxID=333668 RepID=UPI001C61B852|nr:PCI domain protein [Theileria parva strain Muguga]EAN33052.2 PCI domain protein [Theileria parva strain Muguga]